MSLILQKIRNWNHSSILHKCTVDDGTIPTDESLKKLSSITWEGPMMSRHIAVSLFDKLSKKSSSLTAKVIPVMSYLLRQGSMSFKLEVQYKKPLILKLMESSMKCQGEHVHSLYRELVELIEYEYKRSLLGGDFQNDNKCIAAFIDVPTRTKGDTTREEPIEAIISPEKLGVERITRASCIEMLPPMVEIWQFAGQYKHLNQHVINQELTAVLKEGEPMSQLRALSVIDYLTQHYHNSCKGAFLQQIRELARSENMDLRKLAQKVFFRLVEDDEFNEITPCPSPPSTPGGLATQTLSRSRDNIYSSSHMKRSYDKIVPATVGYRTMPSRCDRDETLLDLGSPCSSSSYNPSPSPPSRGGIFTLFGGASPTLTGALGARRGSAGSTDNLLDESQMSTTQL